MGLQSVVSGNKENCYILSNNKRGVIKQMEGFSDR
jgi:hypothetical protein